jgi:hypothetical protein
MVEDMFEVSMRWPGRSCGTAGGAHSQLNGVAQQLNERSPETLGFETRAERDLMLVLHRPIEPTTPKPDISGPELVPCNLTLNPISADRKPLL